ncbi:hypothetical protein AB0K60_03490 [Thermopolyspora sp. NPDC052614]|uniref:hypothetical protein n=1 Tax=Thermopolyspora sp. NPDC052614 TaxID=3155682 RepID=UPI00342506CF
MNAKRRVTAASSTVLLAATLVLGTASGASAAPQDCSYTIANLTASSFCASGTGEHRIFVMQRHFLPEVGQIPIYGPWQPVGTVSSTGITPHEILYVQIQRRG